jgi:glycosyltransferase involved in cell wall biosynthesis
MKIIVLRHYPPSEGPSMLAFADLVTHGMRKRGHQVAELTPPFWLGGWLPQRTPWHWLGYVDQFLIFPPILWWRLRSLSPQSLIVLTDQALGPWMFVVRQHPHVVHVHDLLALEGSLGLLPEHHPGLSGRIYQRWIRHGFRHALCFLSVSAATRLALQGQLSWIPLLSEVLHNPLPSRFGPLPAEAVEAVLQRALPQLQSRRFLLHIGRNWYKNRLGVLAIWERLANRFEDLDLVLVGDLDPAMKNWLQERPFLSHRLRVLDRASDEMIVALYNGAAGLLFPSHYEGFGWPILEALACGCSVFTTDRAPMSEVGGSAAVYLPPCPPEPELFTAWADQSAELVAENLEIDEAEAMACRQLRMAWAHTFDQQHWLDQLERHYHRALALQGAG